MASIYRSVFDIIGPIMVGPSSSHTAGAVAIGKAARVIFQDMPTKVTVHYYESFAKTHRGHGTDFAIAAGIMGFSPDDKRVPKAPQLAKMAGIDIRYVEEEGPSPIHHPNTAILDMVNGDHQTTVGGCSVGGGAIEIRLIKAQHVELTPTGPLPIVLYLDRDKNLRHHVEALKQQLIFGNGLKKEQKKQAQTGDLYEFDMSESLSPEKIAKLEKKYKGIVFLK